MASRIQTVAANFTATTVVSPWIKHDYRQTPFNLSLAVYFDVLLAATLAVQLVVDDQSNTSERPVAVVQSASTTATVTDYGPDTINGAPSNQAWGGPFGHGLLSGDVVFLAGTQAGIDGAYAVTVVDQHTYTITTLVNQTIAVQARATTGRVFTHPSLTALVARATGNYGSPVWMSRLVCTAHTTTGVGYLVAIQGAN